MRNISHDFARWALSAALVILSLTVLAEEDTALPVVKLSPQVRSSPPQGEAYSEMDCEQLSRTTQAQTAAEQRTLADRKNHCLEQYRQFIPNTGLR